MRGPYAVSQWWSAWKRAAVRGLVFLVVRYVDFGVGLGCFIDFSDRTAVVAGFIFATVVVIGF